MRSKNTAFLVPLKSFGSAKERLGEELDTEARSELMRSLAANVLDAAGQFSRWVVCDDTSVAHFALAHRAQVMWRGGGLNAAVQACHRQLACEGFARVIVSHGDLAQPGSFEQFAPSDDRVVIASDRHGGGSNVVSVPTDADYRFAYGPGSFARHVGEARRCGLEITEIDALHLDIDTPEDLELYRQHMKLTVS
ncbi:MAG: 2-phospho-L-lactate guanylyltransferase [Acidimicrobiales bacterium]